MIPSLSHVILISIRQTLSTRLFLDSRFEIRIPFMVNNVVIGEDKGYFGDCVLLFDNWKYCSQLVFSLAIEMEVTIFLRAEKCIESRRFLNVSIQRYSQPSRLYLIF